MRQSLKPAIPELFQAWEALSAAADAHLRGDATAAEALFHEADIPVLWDWLYPHWEKCHLNVVDKTPEGDSLTVAKVDRDPVRGLGRLDKTAVLRRDGYRCRYCGTPVISPEARKMACRLYPAAVPWDQNDPRKRHMGFQALWLQFDHVVPHSHGGRTDLANSVVSCALCNFGKDKYSLRQLGLEDPRLRAPVLTDWDGLDRLCGVRIGRPKLERQSPSRPDEDLSQARGATPERRGTFFLAGARIAKGYLYTRPIQGRERWFRLGAGVHAEAATRAGENGCLLTCAEGHLLRRGLMPEDLVALAERAAGPEQPAP
jgi:5-methylcytosine-specific restriction endonuclease McrA